MFVVDCILKLDVTKIKTDHFFLLLLFMLVSDGGGVIGSVAIFFPKPNTSFVRVAKVLK